MKVVDSSVWLETVTDGPLADRCHEHVAIPEAIITPTVVLHEVYRALRRGDEERAAMDAVAEIELTQLAPLDVRTAITAADLSVGKGLPAVDSVIYATARLHRCELVTLDPHFRGLPGVVLIEAGTQA